MSDSKEPIVFINWQEVRRRSSRLRFVLVAGLYYLAILALILEAFHMAVYAANQPAGPWKRIHVASLVGLELAAIWFLTLIRKQRRGRVVSTAHLVRAVHGVVYRVPVQ